MLACRWLRLRGGCAVRFTEYVCALWRRRCCAPLVLNAGDCGSGWRGWSGGGQALQWRRLRRGAVEDAVRMALAGLRDGGEVLQRRADGRGCASLRGGGVWVGLVLVEDGVAEVQRRAAACDVLLLSCDECACLRMRARSSPRCQG